MFTFAQAKTKAKKKVMGVLDIYGFEVFEVRKLPEIAKIHVSINLTRRQCQRSTVYKR